MRYEATTDLERVEPCVLPDDDLKQNGKAERFCSNSSDLSTLQELFNLNPDNRTPEIICARIAHEFHVRKTEVGLLWIQGGSLKFLFPRELGGAGVTPLSSSAIAARTAKTLYELRSTAAGICRQGCRPISRQRQCLKSICG
jgi:hypothetical protein